MTLKKIYQFDPHTGNIIKNLYVPEETWNKAIKERNNAIKRACGL